mmetsp:Transcript_21789/g.43641  ORF Transcript_21789/g.43641 Transcript_21789/m.43641 type:complete len:565 (+) Transcript_21789:290-1984(+)
MMSQVKEFFDSLPVEQKRNLSMGLRGGDGQKEETLVKISHLVQNQNFDGDMEQIGIEFYKLLNDFSSQVLVRNDEATTQIKNYFESLSDHQKRTMVGDLFGGDEQKKREVLGSLWRFDGDLLENTKFFVELVRDYTLTIEIGSLPQEDLQEKKDRGEKNEREHITAEKERVDDVVRRHKELYPPQTRECPVCLDDIEMTEHNSMVYFYCCGQGTCFDCFKKNVDSDGALFHAKCPLCRSTINNDAVTRTNRIKKCAERGFSWAQLKMSKYCLQGCEEAKIPVDEKKSNEWLQLAAGNSSPDLDAIVTLSNEYKEGVNVDKSKAEKVAALMKKAADMGSRRAQEEVAVRLWDMKDNGVKADAVYYATLAISERPTFIQYGAAIHSAFVLGLAFHYGQGGMEENSYLARYYFKIAVQGNANDLEHVEGNFRRGLERAYCYYGEALIMLGTELYGGISVPGFSPIPKAMYWFHKATTLGCACDNPNCWKEEAKRSGERWMDSIKCEESKICSHCQKAAEDCPGEKLKNCARCRGAWYCGRDCQAAAWKAGHKLDCVKLSGPNKAALH